MATDMSSVHEFDVRYTTVRALEHIIGEPTAASREVLQELLVDYSAKELYQIIQETRFPGVVEEVSKMAMSQTVAAMELGLHQEMQEYKRVRKLAEQVANGNYFVEY